MPAPAHALVLTDPDLLERAYRYVRAQDVEPQKVEGIDVRVGNWGGVDVAVLSPPDPAAALRALAKGGVRAALLVGTAESLNPILVPGTLVVVDRAVGPSEDDAAPANPNMKDGIEAALGSEFCRWQCGPLGTAERDPAHYLALRERGAQGLVPAAVPFFRAASETGVAAGAVFVLGDELGRMAPLDVDVPLGILWEPRAADPKMLEGPTGAMLRGAFGALTGYDPAAGKP